MKIKICGITEIETLNFLIENGVDYVGFIFHEKSPRNVTHAFINEIKNKFTVTIDEVEIIKEDVVFKVPKKLN